MASESEYNNSKTIPDLIYDFLYKNGASKTREIFDYIFSLRDTVTKDSINVTMWNNRQVFKHKGYGKWDIQQNPKSERIKQAYYKAIVILNYYRDLLKTKYHNITDERTSGVILTEEDDEYIEKLVKKFKTD